MLQAHETAAGSIPRHVVIGLICLSLTALTWLVFGQTVQHDFINFDDDVEVYDNAAVQQGLGVESVKWAFTHTPASLWHPLTTISHMFDCSLFGLKAGGHHFTNVLLHNGGVLLLFLVLLQMTGNLGGSAFVAAIFAIHPLRVESVAWITERKDVLSGVFFALTLGAYSYYARAPSIGRYLPVAIFLACGLMSKAMLVSVPIILLLLDYWPLQRLQFEEPPSDSDVTEDDGLETVVWWKLLLEKIPLLLLCIASSVVTVRAQTITLPTLAQLGFLPRLKNAVVSIAIYLGQIVWPAKLAIFYPHPRNQLSAAAVTFSLALIVIVSVVAVMTRHKNPHILVGWCWFLVMLIPVLGLVQAGAQGHGDRFTYLPHIGLTIAITWAVADLSARWATRDLIIAGLAVFLVVAFAFTAWKQTGYWHDSISVWEHALAVGAESSRAHDNLAGALRQAGRTSEAVPHERAADILRWRTAVENYPLDPTLRDNLGVALVQNGDVRGAIEQWQRSIEINPDDGNALNNLAWVWATAPDASNRNERAVELAEHVMKLSNGSNPLIFRTVAAAYANNGRFYEAAAMARQGMEIALEQNNSGLADELRVSAVLYESRSPLRDASLRSSAH